MQSKPFYKEPAVALAFAVGAAVLSHKANANAARVLGVSAVVVGIVVAVILALASVARG